MNAVFTFFRRLFSFHKYPRYLMDFYVALIMQRIWRFTGIKLGKQIIWDGKPIFSMFKGSLISIGNNCRICSDSTRTALGVNHPAVLSTLRPGARLEIGSRVRMSGTTICAAERVTIGDRCVIGANVIIADTDFHSLDPAIRSTLADDQFAVHSPVSIGCDVFIGGNSIILKGVSIGDGAVIGAGSVVTRSIAPGMIAAGNPAHPIAKVSDALQARSKNPGESTNNANHLL